MEEDKYFGLQLELFLDLVYPNEEEKLLEEEWEWIREQHEDAKREQK